MISKIKKLKGRSLGELADRGRQRAEAIAERVGVSRDLKMPRDAEFLSLFKQQDLTNSGQLLEIFLRPPNCFYPVFDHRESAISLLQKRFPTAKISVINRADKICEGRFDLLGYHDLDFGKPVPDWHLDPVSGKRSPMRHWSQIDEAESAETGDTKVIWELNRHQYFTTLGQAYWMTGDEKYCDVFVSHLEDWIDKNPPKIGVNWMSGLEIAFRSISWIWAFHFFRDSPRLLPEIFIKMLKVLYLNARHLERHLSTYSSPNTHLTGETLGLYMIGTFLKEIDEAAAWKRAGYEILIDALEFQIRKDGGYVEQALYYQRYTADFYLSLLILRKAEGLPVDVRHENALQRMLKFLLHCSQPDGRMPLIGDDDGGRLHFLDDCDYSDFSSTFAVGAALMDDEELKFAAREAGAELMWLTGPEGVKAYDKLEQTIPAATHKAFEASGFYVIRDRWERDANFILIDCGEHGFLNGGHAHADALSFVMSVKGVPVFVDSGTYKYSADQEARDYFRSTGAHNCLTVNGQSSSVPGGPFSWTKTAASRVLEWKAGREEVLFRGSHDGYERFGVKYEREFRSESDGTMTVIDKIDAMSKSNIEISFILSPDVEAEITSPDRVILRIKDGKKTVLTINTKVTEDSEVEFDGWRVEPARISPRYGSLVDTTMLLFAVTRDRSFAIQNSFRINGIS